MPSFRDKLTIGKIVMATYLTVWIFPLVLTTCVQVSLSERINWLRSQVPISQSAFAETLDSKSEPTSFGLASSFRRRLPGYRFESAQIEYLINFKFTAYFIVIGTFLIGLAFVSAHIRHINRAFARSAKSIANLSEGQLNEPIRAYGFKDFSLVGGQLEKLRKRLIATERHQVDFLRHISHEIKTPLTSIKEGTKLLQDEVVGNMNEEQREVTDILNSSTRELQTSIESLLNFNSALSVQQVRQREIVNLADLISQTIVKHALTIKTKDIEVISNRQNHRAFVDKEQILTVVDNLFSNAIKHSPIKGRIWVRLDHIKDDIILTIKDQGNGIENEHKAAVFDAFYVGKKKNAGPLKGTGLGLSIARQYVEAHRGTIKALDSNKGAVFEVTLPA